MVKNYLNSRVQTLGTMNDKPSRTQQHFKNEVNIHEIIRRSMKNAGHLPLPAQPPTYCDVSTFTGFREAQTFIAEAMQSFAQMPAAIRKRFNNNAGDLLEFVQNPENYEEALKLGLVNKREEPLKDVAANTGSVDNTSSGQNAGETGGSLPKPPTQTAS